ncbi:hypothetical protein GCM10027590_55140 [Nocardiopsis nanhaiensis]
MIVSPPTTQVSLRPDRLPGYWEVFASITLLLTPLPVLFLVLLGPSALDGGTLPSATEDPGLWVGVALALASALSWALLAGQWVRQSTPREIRVAREGVRFVYGGQWGFRARTHLLRWDDVALIVPWQREFAERPAVALPYGRRIRKKAVRRVSRPVVDLYLEGGVEAPGWLDPVPEHTGYRVRVGGPGDPMKDAVRRLAHLLYKARPDRFELAEVSATWFSPAPGDLPARPETAPRETAHPETARAEDGAAEPAEETAAPEPPPALEPPRGTVRMVLQRSPASWARRTLLWGALAGAAAGIIVSGVGEPWLPALVILPGIFCLVWFLALLVTAPMWMSRRVTEVSPHGIRFTAAPLFWYRISVDATLPWSDVAGVHLRTVPRPRLGAPTLLRLMTGVSQEHGGAQTLITFVLRPAGPRPEGLKQLGMHLVPYISGETAVPGTHYAGHVAKVDLAFAADMHPEDRSGWDPGTGQAPPEQVSPALFPEVLRAYTPERCHGLPPR